MQQETLESLDIRGIWKKMETSIIYVMANRINLGYVLFQMDCILQKLNFPKQEAAGKVEAVIHGSNGGKI